MRIEYNKLVRNRIPDIIRSDGRRCETSAMSDEEYREALRTKLIEEAQEASKADSKKLVTELADLYEVIDAIMAAEAVARDAVLAEQSQRRAERGGFDQRIRLLWAE